MPTAVVTGLLVLFVAVGSIVLVMVGEEGMLEHRAPALARHARRVLAHLNGTAAPPQKLVTAVADGRTAVRESVHHLGENVRESVHHLGENVRERVAQH